MTGPPDEDPLGGGEDGELPEGARPYESAAGRKKGQPFANRIAERLLVKHNLMVDHTGAVFQYTGTHWLPATDAMLLKWAFEESGGFANSAGNLRGEAVAAVKAARVVENLKWGRVHATEIACLSGVLDVESGRVRPHRPEHNLNRIVPWEYVQGHGCPRWRRALDEWFGPDNERIGALQEFFGYVLLGHCRFKKALLLWGPSNSGKSAPLLVLMALVGRDAVCQLSLDDMEDPRRRGVIVGAALNVMTELPYEALIRDGAFKQIVSGEPILIDDKWRLPFLHEPTAKHVIATEALPRLNDRSAGGFNRILLIPFERVFADDEQDAGLVEGLIADEMVGVFAWSVEGARRLIQHGGEFAAPKESLKAMAKYRRDHNPVIAFLEEACIQEPGTASPLGPLLKQFNYWQRGSKRYDRRAFAAMLREAAEQEPALGLTIKKVKRKVTGGQSVLSLVNYRFLAMDDRVQFQVKTEDALGPAAEIEAEAETNMDDATGGRP